MLITWPRAWQPAIVLALVLVFDSAGVQLQTRLALEQEGNEVVDGRVR
jgi:hypothetical protein